MLQGEVRLFQCHSLGSAHWVSPENTSVEQPRLLTGRQERIPQAVALKMVLKGKNPVISKCALKPEAMGRFAVEPEEGRATPETQELSDGSPLSLIPFFIFEHRVGWVTLGQGVYICV